MTLGRAPEQGDVWQTTAKYCEGKLSPTSIYGLLHHECHRLFPDDSFADLFRDIGRRSVPPRIVAVVMVLQRLEGLSDREAVDRFTFDVRWKYAAGGLDLDYPGFVHTVLVDLRARLRSSEDPNRIFTTVLDVARAAGLVGRRRVLDSTPLYDAVATQDTVTMIRAAIRGVLRVAEEPVVTALRGVLKRDDDYASAGKPVCDWDDAPAREALVEALARDAYAVLIHLEGSPIPAEMKDAATLLATVVGQDLELTEDGCFRIARRVAPNRVISTVDPETRHGHQTAARGFDGHKGHIAIDPDSEIITASVVTAGNVADGHVMKELLEEILPAKIPSEKARRACRRGFSRSVGNARRGDERQHDHVRNTGRSVRRCVVRNRRRPAPSRRGRRRAVCESSGRHGARGAVHEGGVSHRSRERDGDVSQRPTRSDPPWQGRLGTRELRDRLQSMPVGAVVHHVEGGPEHPAASARADLARHARSSEEPRVAREVQSNASQGRTKARASDAPSPRRASRSHARDRARRTGLRDALRRGQPASSRDAQGTDWGEPCGRCGEVGRAGRPRRLVAQEPRSALRGIDPPWSVEGRSYDRSGGKPYLPWEVTGRALWRESPFDTRHLA